MASHYNHGAYFPMGGSKSIAKTIVASIQRRGGKVFASAPVEKIITERSLWGDEATGVRVHGIDISVRKAVVSDAGFTKTFEVGLDMDPPLVDKAVGASQLALVHTKDVNYHFRPSPAFFYLFVGLEGSDKDLHLPGQNIWQCQDWHEHTTGMKHLYEAHDIDEAIAIAPPLVFVSSESAKDPDYQKNHPNKSTVTIIAWTDPKWFKEWANKPHGTRGDHYDKVKDKMTEVLLGVLYKHFPLTCGKVRFTEMGTPLSTKKYLSHDAGAIYNLDHNTERFDSLGAQLALHPQSTIRHLYLTGQDVTAVSIVGSMMSGFLTAARISTSAFMLLCGLRGLVMRWIMMRSST